MIGAALLLNVLLFASDPVPAPAVPQARVLMTDGSVLVGTVVEENGGRIVLETVLGRVEVPRDQLLRIEPVSAVAPPETPIPVATPTERSEPVVPDLDTVPFGDRARGAAMSAVLPGWGQLNQRRPIAAGVYAGAAVSSVALFFTTREYAEDAKHYAKQAGPLDEKRFQRQATRYERAHESSRYLLAGVWTVAIVDAFVGAGAAQPGITAAPVTNGETLGFGIAGRF